jgi:hypothetical protein
LDGGQDGDMDLYVAGSPHNLFRNEGVAEVPLAAVC